jgi:hypothetical protein
MPGEHKSGAPRAGETNDLLRHGFSRAVFSPSLQEVVVSRGTSRVATGRQILALLSPSGNDPVLLNQRLDSAEQSAPLYTLPVSDPISFFKICPADPGRAFRCECLHSS